MNVFSSQGAAGICINDKNEVLMVLQAAPEEEKKWTVPTGTLEEGETFQACCEREFYEVTGLIVRTDEKIHNKSGVISEYGISYYVEYFLVEIESGEITFQDSDEFIHEVAWKSLEEIKMLPLSYPEDIHILEQVLEK